MRILVAGAGMYVTGREGTGQGTVLCSLAEWSRGRPDTEVVVAARSPGNAVHVKSAADRINAQLGTRLPVSYATVPDSPSEAVAGLLAKGPIDAAVISLPDSLHAPYAAALMEAGVHCLVVKPLTPTLKEARGLVELQRRCNVHGAVEFHKRWDETNLYARKLLLEGSLGKPLYAAVEYSQRRYMPLDVLKSWAGEVNVFQYLGVHYVDLLWFLTGLMPKRAMAVGTRGLLEENGIDGYDSIHSIVQWEGGFVSQLVINWIDPNETSALSDQKYRLVGTLGRLDLDQKNRGLDLVLQGRRPAAMNPYFSEPLPTAEGGWRFDGYGHRSIARFMDDVADIRAGKQTPAGLEGKRPTFRDALVSSAIIESVSRSLEDGGEWKEIENVF